MSEKELVLRLVLLLSGILMIIVMLLRARLLAGRPREHDGRDEAPAEPGALLPAHARGPEDRGCRRGLLAETHGLE